MRVGRPDVAAKLLVGLLREHLHQPELLLFLLLPHLLHDKVHLLDLSHAGDVNWPVASDSR